jgi:magnesium chelatase subunit D
MTEIESAWEDALLAIRIAEVARDRIGGIHVRARSGPVRDIWLKRFTETLKDTSVIRFSPGVDEGRLLGDLDLSRTLAEGKPVLSKGLLARADESVILLTMAERAEPTLCGILAAAMDTGSIKPERSGVSEPQSARFTLIAFDESADDSEHLPLALGDRLALRIDLNPVSWRMAEGDLSIPEPARIDPDDVAISDPVLTALATAAEQAGWHSMRSLIWLSTVSRIVAAIENSQSVEPSHASTAIRLVFGPTIVSDQTEELEDEASDETPPPPDPPEHPDDDDSEPQELDLEQLKEMLVAAEAAKNMQLPILLPAEAAGANARASGKSGAKKDKARRGRPLGFTPAPPYPGAKPNILATIRAAAPWQRIRERERGKDAPARRIDIRKSDFRYRRLKDRSETTVIFAVDASGSTALARLGEAKGAVELLLNECYIRRDSVAVIAFRGAEADVLLEPTRSLVRAKRALGKLPGGGPTPLASAMAKSLELSTRVAREGQTPLLVMMTDGNGNIALDGTASREQSREEVKGLARQLAVQNMQVVMIDISARPRDIARTFAANLNADYVALPRTDAASVSRLVSTYMKTG